MRHSGILEASVARQQKTPMSHYHCVVWIDHREAHVIQFNPDDAQASVVHPKSKHQHLHHKQGSVGSGRAPEDLPYAAGAVAGQTARDVFVFIIGGAKERNPAAAQALMARLDTPPLG